MPIETLDKIRQATWRTGLKLKGVGELLESHNMDSASFDSEDCKIGLGLLLKDLGSELLSISESVSAKESSPKKKKRSRKLKK